MRPFSKIAAATCASPSFKLQQSQPQFRASFAKPLYTFAARLLWFLVLKHAWWWDCFVKWGEARRWELPHWQLVPAICERRLSILILVSVADEILCTLADELTVGVDTARTKARNFKKAMHRDGLENTGKSVCCNGPSNVGVFWFKVRGTDRLENVWEETDRSCINCFYEGPLPRALLQKVMSQSCIRNQRRLHLKVLSDAISGARICPRRSGQPF